MQNGGSTASLTPVPQPKPGLLTRRVGAEVVIYDVERSQSHCLETLAGRIFEMCDGGTGIAEIAERLDVSADVVMLTLRRLERAGLVQSARSPWRLQSTRRELLRKLAVIGGLGIVSGLLPTAANAQSCLPTGAPCAFIVPCCPGCICIGGICAGSCK